MRAGSARLVHAYPMDPSSVVQVARPGAGPALIELERGDITAIRVDVIVNAANSHLGGGGGVDGAIHRAAGPGLMAELSARYRGCPTGSAVITGPGRLADHGVRNVIHAVGPIWRGGGGGEEELLRSAYLRSMALAEEAGATSVAFPAISCGVYGYPLAEGAGVAVRAVRDGLTAAPSVERAVFVLFSGEVFDAFRRALAELSNPDADTRRGAR
jgi:O-acetyl-ADP-ribose deacetylase (regulator of RNase III)